MDEMEHAGHHIHKSTNVKELKRGANGLVTVSYEQAGKVASLEGFDIVVFAIGRHPNVEGLQVEKVGVTQDSAGHIVVDEYQYTGTPGVFALGDVCGKWLLTPGLPCCSE
jgi:glutathione reductase (NADPH)